MVAIDLEEENEENKELTKEVLAYIERHEKEYDKQINLQRKAMRHLADNIQVDGLTIIVNSTINPVLEKIEKILGRNEEGR